MGVALVCRAAALTVDIAKRDDRVGRVVDLESLPIHARRGAVAVTGTAGVPRSTQGQHQRFYYSTLSGRSWRYSRVPVNAWIGAARRVVVVAVASRV
jgi:hypothetical protein